MTFLRIRMGAAACVFGALGVLAGGAVQAQGGPGRVGFVATERLYAESKLAKAADARILAEFSGRDKANQAMFASLKKMSEAFEADAPALRDPERTRRAREVLDLDKEAQRKQTAYRDDLLRRKDEERAHIAERASGLIARIAEQEKIDIVLFRDVLWTRPGVDITDKIIRQLDQ